MIWKTSIIEPYLEDVKSLFAQNREHKHADNYIKHPLFEWTVFSHMGWDNNKLVYYSAGIERPEYDGSIRIMSRHTRDRTYNFGNWSDDIKRGVNTLDVSTEYALDLGYENVWVSREESPNLLKILAKKSKYNWSITYSKMHYGGYQYIMELQNDSRI